MNTDIQHWWCRKIVPKGLPIFYYLNYILKGTVSFTCMDFCSVTFKRDQIRIVENKTILSIWNNNNMNKEFFLVKVWLKYEYSFIKLGYGGKYIQYYI